MESLNVFTKPKKSKALEKEKKAKNRNYSEVRNILAHKKFNKNAEAEVVIRTAYVDSTRNVAFEQTSDLKGVMKEQGLKNSANNDFNPGEPNNEMYLRQAEHLMKRGAYNPALVYLHQSLQMKPDSKVI